MSGSDNATAAKAKEQDLSYADQQELLAFIEKRNWFEAKLDVSLWRKALMPRRSRPSPRSIRSCTQSLCKMRN